MRRRGTYKSVAYGGTKRRRYRKSQSRAMVRRHTTRTMRSRLLRVPSVHSIPYGGPKFMLRRFRWSGTIDGFTAFPPPVASGVVCFQCDPQGVARPWHIEGVTTTEDHEPIGLRETAKGYDRYRVVRSKITVSTHEAVAEEKTGMIGVYLTTATRRNDVHSQQTEECIERGYLKNGFRVRATGTDNKTVARSAVYDASKWHHKGFDMDQLWGLVTAATGQVNTLTVGEYDDNTQPQPRFMIWFASNDGETMTIPKIQVSLEFVVAFKMSASEFAYHTYGV